MPPWAYSSRMLVAAWKRLAAWSFTRNDTLKPDRLWWLWRALSIWWRIQTFHTQTFGSGTCLPREKDANKNHSSSFQPRKRGKSWKLGAPNHKLHRSFAVATLVLHKSKPDWDARNSCGGIWLIHVSWRFQDFRIPYVTLASLYPYRKWVYTAVLNCRCHIQKRSSAADRLSWWNEPPA